MWILSSEGDFLKGKSIWLRPGKKYLFGRVSSEGSPPRNYGVDHKSISRKHLVIDVAPVKSGDGLHLHTRSQVTIEDQGSKIGTKLDGQKVLSKTTLSSDHHVIKLGNYEYPLKIKWQSVVITYSLSGKGKETLSVPRSRLEDLDIKTIDSYATEYTTHVVATKRNTPKGLQALINGKYIVIDSYIDAVVYAATPEVFDSPESLSPLEQDFDAAWPDALKHLPPKGKEPTDRPASSYAPNENRRNVFQFYTFVFADRNQFNTLQSPIASGHGKALFYEAKPGTTTIDQFMQFVRSVAEDKGLNGFGNKTDLGGVVVVNYQPKGQENWANSLYHEVALRMDQRCPAQNEFLEAILANDASFMKRALEASDSTPPSRPPPSTVPAAIKSTHSIPSGQQKIIVEDSQIPSRRARPRTAAVSRIKAFDDGFDMDLIPNVDPEPDENEASPQIAPERSLSASFNPPDANTNGNKSQASMKRPQPDLEDDDEDDVNSLLPAATAMKKRRLELEGEDHQKGITDHFLTRSQMITAEPTKKSRSKRKDTDVMEAARERREAEEAAAKWDRENLEAELEGMDIDAMRNLAVVEEMEIVERHDRLTRASGENSERWDERWNGRKNFKKFRRTRDLQEDGPRSPRQRMQAVIVPLVEVKRKDYGIGHEYWEDGDRRRGKEKAGEGGRGGGKRNQNHIAVSEDKGGPTLKIFGSVKEPQSSDMDDEDMNADANAPDNPPSPSFTTARTRLEDEAASIVGDDAIDVDQLHTTRAHDHEKVVVNKSQAYEATKAKGRRKRPAEEEMPTPGKAKIVKARRLTEPEDEDSDEGDGLKFRFKRKR